MPRIRRKKFTAAEAARCRADAALRDEARRIMKDRKCRFRQRMKAWGIWVVFSYRVRTGRCRKDPPKWFTLKWHGDHCGPGHGDVSKGPQDALDASCKVHDQAYRDSRKL